MSEQLGAFRNGDAAFAEAARRSDTRGRAFLARVDGPEAFAKHACTLLNPLGGGESARVGRVHCLIRLGDTTTALDELAALEGARGIAELRAALRSCLAEALALLDEWERQTVERVPDLARL